MMNDQNSEQRAESIDEWCHRRRISRATYFKLKRMGQGPETLHILNVVRITARTDAEWEQRMTALSRGKAAALEQERRIEQASRAGKAAARSPLHISRLHSEKRCVELATQN